MTDEVLNLTEALVERGADLAVGLVAVLRLRVDPALDPVQQMLLCDTTILLSDVFLEKVDRPTMAFSIESGGTTLVSGSVSFETA